MNNLLLAMGFWEDDAPRAEGLLDWIFQLNDRQKEGHALLIAAPGCHGEMIEKIRISADLAFSSFQLLHLPQWATPPRSKAMGINSMFYACARTVASDYGWPWLYAEPDLVPLKRGWWHELATAYHGQPHRYMGLTLMLKAKQPNTPDIKFLSRISVYPANALHNIAPLCQKEEEPFERNDILWRKATRSTLIQQGHFDADMSIIRPDAVCFHSDKNMWLIPALREQRHQPVKTSTNGDTPKIDKRTREYKALRAVQAQP